MAELFKHFKKGLFMSIFLINLLFSIGENLLLSVVSLGLKKLEQSKNNTLDRFDTIDIQAQLLVTKEEINQVSNFSADYKKGLVLTKKKELEDD